LKPVRLRPLARQDRRDEIRYYRNEAGPGVATVLAGKLQEALGVIGENPGIGSPILGQVIGIDGMRTWLVDGFPLTFWYFEREKFVDVARLVGQRQDPLLIDPGGIQANPTTSGKLRT